MDSAASHHHYVDVTEFVLHKTKSFARGPLNPVARNGISGRFYRNCKPQARAPHFVAAPQNGKPAVARPGGTIEHCLEVGRAPQSAAEREPVVPSVAGRWRYGQSRARPLRRRRLSIARPLLLAMRALKPWVRLRRRLLGWNVRFIFQTGK